MKNGAVSDKYWRVAEIREPGFVVIFLSFSRERGKIRTPLSLSLEDKKEEKEKAPLECGWRNVLKVV